MPSTTPIEMNGGTVLEGTSTLLYQVPNNGLVVSRRGAFANVADTTILLTVWKVASGALPTANNIIVDNWPVSPTETYIAPSLANLILTSQESIYAACAPPNSINAFLSGFQTQ